MAYILLRNFLLLLFSFSLMQAYAQTIISGQVRDSLTSEPLIGANVTIRSQGDSLITGVATDRQGNFQFQKEIPLPFKLEITYLGYKKYQRLFRETVSNIGTVYLIEEKKFLQGVTVEGDKPIGETKGDTVSFNAQAFKTKTGADTEELLQKMPGITVENNTVKAQGEEVRQVLVDGKPFFGNDPSLALKNLPADVVERIEVFDQLSEQSQFTGFDDGQTTRTINIVTREDRRNGEFGKVYAAAGTQERYLAGGNMNFFKGDRRISVIGMSNNINQQNFSSQDLLGVVGSSNQRRNFGGGGGGRGGRGGGQRGGGGGGGNASNNFMVGQQGGINTTHSVGLNFSNTWNKKWEVNGSYFFNSSNNASSEIVNREYFTAQNNGLLYKEESDGNSENFNHRFNLRANYTINENNSLLIRPSISFQNNNAFENLVGSNVLNGELLSQTNNNSSSFNSGYSISNELLYRHRFAKRGRTISLNVRTGLNDRDGERFLNAINDTGEARDTLRQQTNTQSDGFNYNAGVSYTEPLSQKSQLQLNYNLGNNISSSDQYTYTFDQPEEEVGILNPGLSNVFDNHYLTHRAGAGYRYNATKFNIMTNLSYQRADLSSEATYPLNSSVRYIFDNFLPMANINYKFGTQTNLRISYRTSTNAPSIQQLQNVINNSNPLQLSSGNPSLDQQYTHTFITRFTRIDVASSKNLIAFVSAGVTRDYIGNNTIIASADTLINEVVTLPAGGQYTYPVNFDQSINLRSFATYGFRIAPIKSNVSINASADHSASPSLINGVENKNRTTSFTPGISINSNISEKLDFSLSTSRSFNVVRNTLQPNLNSNYTVHNTTVKFYWNFWKNFFVDNAITHQQYAGLATPYNQSIVFWSASAGTRFLKDNRGELKIMVYDLLNQNTNIRRNITESYAEDTQTRILRQYFMLSFTYRLNAFKA